MVLLRGDVRKRSASRRLDPSLEAVLRLPAVLLAIGFLSGSLTGRILPVKSASVIFPAVVSTVLSVIHPTPMGLMSFGFSTGYLYCQRPEGKASKFVGKQAGGTYEGSVISSESGCFGGRNIDVRIKGSGRDPHFPRSFEASLIFKGASFPEPGSRIRFRCVLRYIGGGKTRLAAYKGRVVDGSWVTLSKPGYFRQLRNRMVRDVRELVSNDPDHYSGVLAAIAIGEKDLIPWRLRRAMRRTGTSHLLAISGVHVGSVGLIVLLASRLISAWLSSGNRVRLQNFQVSFLCLLAWWVYIAITGLSTSALRAVLFACLLTAGHWFNRHHVPLVSLSWCLIIFGYLSAGTEPGVALGLSLSACVGILLCLNTPGKAPLYVFRITAAAYLFTIPISVIVFGGMSVISPVMNILVGIPFSVLLIPLALLLDLLTLIHYPTANQFCELWSILADPLLEFTIFVGEWKWVYFPLSHWGRLAASISAIITCGLWYLCRRSLSLILVLTLLPLLAGLAGQRAGEHVESGTLRILFPGLGQADGIVIADGSATVLIDCGPPGSMSYGPPIERHLLKAGVGQIDALILTHPHPDHVGGAGQVLSIHKVKRVILPHSEDSLEIWHSVLSHVPEGTDVSFVAPGDRFRFGNMGFEVKLIGAEGKAASDDINEISPILLMKWGGFLALFTGDAGWESTTRAVDGIEKLGLIKLPHHGSASGFQTSSVRAWIRKFRQKGPFLAVCTANDDGTRQLPAEEVMEFLRSEGVPVHLTGSGSGLRIHVRPPERRGRGVVVDKVYRF
jgi:ComEC/Rec2-related protein